MQAKPRSCRRKRRTRVDRCSPMESWPVDKKQTEMTGATGICVVDERRREDVIRLEKTLDAVEKKTVDDTKEAGEYSLHRRYRRSRVSVQVRLHKRGHSPYQTTSLSLKLCIAHVSFARDQAGRG